MPVAPLCPNCLKGETLPGEPKGKIETIGPYETYVAKPSSHDGAAEASKDKAIISLTDVFGLKLPNNKLIADTIAERTGVTVYVPDLFNGNPIDPAGMMIPSSAQEANAKGLLTKLSEGAKMITLVPWIYRNWPTGKYADLESLIGEIKTKYDVKRVGVVGTCYGGRLAIDLNKAGSVDVSVANHPGMVNGKSFSGLKCPILLNLSEHDDFVPSDTVEKLSATLKNDPSTPEHDIKVFEGTAHSFAARPNLSNDVVKKAFEDATSRTIDWFTKYL